MLEATSIDFQVNLHLYFSVIITIRCLVKTIFHIQTILGTRGREMKAVTGHGVDSMFKSAIEIGIALNCTLRADLFVK